MTDKMIENRIQKLQALEAQIAEIEKESEAIKEELKTELDSRSVDELKIKEHIIRYKVIFSNRIDSSAFKTSYPELYDSFCKTTISRRFSIA